MRAARVSYEKARLMARHGDDAAIGEWIDRAEAMTCVALRRALESDEQAQMCAEGNFVAVVPRRVRGLLALAFQAARARASAFLTPGECLRVICEHFLEVWGRALEGRATLAQRILARDKGLCQVPGCSRAAAHAHHIEYRSMGGSDDPRNLVSLCAAHHLIGIHLGWIQVKGEAAPDGLIWRLGT